MLSANDRITLRQFQILFVLEAFGTGFVIMPRLAAQSAGQDGWLVALLLIIPGLVFAALISGAAKSLGGKSGETFVAYTSRLLSKPVSTIICIMLWLKIIFCAGLELHLSGNIIQNILLRRTPSSAVYLILIVVAAYVAAKGIETRARLAEILIVIISVPILILGLIAFTSINYTNLTPMLVTTPNNLAFGVLRLGFIFTGLEFIWLAFPYLNNYKDGHRAAVQAMGIVGLLMAIITAVTLAMFGPYTTKVLEWPVLRLMDMLNIPGSLIARQEALVLSFWLLSVFAFSAASLFYAASLAKDQIGRGKHNLWVMFCALAVFIVAIIPFKQDQIYNMLHIIFLTFGLGFWFVLPIVLMVLNKVKKLYKNAFCMIALSLMITGCWDGVELENRAFAVAIGINTSQEARFNFSTALAVPTDTESSDDGSSAQGQTLIEAIKNMDAKSSRKLSFGQTKSLVLGKDLLEDSNLFSEVIDTIESYSEIDRAITVLATDSDINDILTAHPPNESKPGYYVVNFYRLSPKSGGRSFHQTFDEMTADLRATGNTLIPTIAEGEVKGAIVVKDYQLAGELNETELRGLLWSRDNACNGAVLTTGGNVPMVVVDHKSSLHFTDDTIIIDVQIKGQIPDFVTSVPSTREYEELISNEINRTIQKLQQDLEVDVLNLRKNVLNFTEIEILPLVRCSFV